ncbi:hypothetical protein KBD34_04285 [Patescibacteria group bacterium]|nr:hypothetical protein [Patescibacteria group bacterium]
MQRRTTAILLIIFGILVIVGVVLWLLWPSLNRDTGPVNQPPAYPEGQAPNTEPLPAQPTPQTTGPVDPGLIESKRLEDKLRRMAQDFASRAGSYSNSDDFAGLREAGLEATQGVRTFFGQERTRLIQAYPIRSGVWGQTARGLASRITSQTPIRTQPEVTIQVETQVVTEAGDAAPVTTYPKAEITFQKVGTAWLVSRIQWAE